MWFYQRLDTFYGQHNYFAALFFSSDINKNLFRYIYNTDFKGIMNMLKISNLWYSIKISNLGYSHIDRKLHKIENI